MQRRMSSFAMGKTGTSVNKASSQLDYYSDPRKIGRTVEESFSRHGVEMPQQVRETIDAARQGNVPKGLDI